MRGRVPGLVFRRELPQVIDVNVEAVDRGDDPDDIEDRDEDSLLPLTALQRP